MAPVVPPTRTFRWRGTTQSSCGLALCCGAMPLALRFLADRTDEPSIPSPGRALLVYVIVSFVRLAVYLAGVAFGSAGDVGTICFSGDGCRLCAGRGDGVCSIARALAHRCEVDTTKHALCIGGRSRSCSASGAVGVRLRRGRWSGDRCRACIVAVWGCVLHRSVLPCASRDGHRGCLRVSVVSVRGVCGCSASRLEGPRKGFALHVKVLIDRIFRLSQAFPGVFRCFLGTRTTTPEARANVPALRRTQRACEAVSGRPPRRSALMSFGLVHEDDRAEDNRVGRLVRVRDEAGCWREGLTASSIDERGGRRLYFVCLGTFASVSEAMKHFHALESHGGVVPCMDRAVDLPGLEEKGHVLYVDGMQHPAFSQSSVDDIVHHNYAHIHERGCERVLELRCKNSRVGETTSPRRHRREHPIEPRLLDPSRCHLQTQTRSGVRSSASLHPRYVELSERSRGMGSSGARDCSRFSRHRRRVARLRG